MGGSKVKAASQNTINPKKKKMSEYTSDNLCFEGLSSTKYKNATYVKT